MIRARVALMHRQAVLRQRLTEALESSSQFQVVAQAASFEEGELLFNRGQGVDLALIELSVNGIRLAKRLVSAPVLFASSARPPLDLLLMSLEFDGSGCVCQDDTDDVLRGCTSVLARKAYISPQTSAEVIRELRNRCQNVRLTEREVEILCLLSEGLPLGRAASRLGLSVSTVKSHLSRAYQKLGVNCRDQATAAAASLGLLNTPRKRALTSTS